MFNKLWCGFVSVLLMAVTMAASAKPEKYEFDKSHTRIFYEVNHLGFSDYRGMFHKYDGHFTFDPNDLSKSKIDVTVDIKSADMYHDKMNEHLLAEDILNAKKYPQAKFVSTDVKPGGQNSAIVTGNLTLHGVTKPLTLKVVFNKAGKNPFSKKFTRGFTATGTLDRTEFGINYAAPMVSKEVNLTISVEGIRVD